MPKISIIIPIFNTARYLRECVDSCLSQNVREIEVILIEDKSSDSSLQIAKEFESRDSRVVLVENEANLGTFLARINGAKIARGEYILFLDSDDFLAQNALESLYNLMRQNCADMGHFGIMHEPKIHATLPKIYTQTLEGDEVLGQIFVRDIKRAWLIVCSRIFSANLVRHATKKLSFINAHLIASEDSLLFFTLCALAKKSVGVCEKFYIYRISESSLTRSLEAQKLQKQIEDRAFIKALLPRLAEDGELAQNFYFLDALKNLENLLNYFICFSRRFLADENARGVAIPPYLKYSVLSFKYMARWQIAAKLAIYLATLGKKKL